MIVMKFGGTSVGNADMIKRVAAIVSNRLRREPVVVVSAVGGITNLLLEAAEKARKRSRATESLLGRFRDVHDGIISSLGLRPGLIRWEFASLAEVLHGVYCLGELTPRTLDYVAHFGERVSAKIVSAYLVRTGIPSRPLMGWEAGIITDDRHLSASPLPGTYANIRRRLRSRKRVPVVTGFIAKNARGEVTTIGRGGSDFTAALIGRALHSEEIQIWTDVPGIMTADPRVIPRAKTISKLSFAEAAELAYFGAKVLHPRTIEPAVEKEIPVRILNTFDPSARGTLVVRDARRPRRAVRAIAVKKNNVLFNLRSTRMLDSHGYMAGIFEVFDRYAVPVDLIATSEVGVSVTVDESAAPLIKSIIADLGRICTASTVSKRAVVCIVGEGIARTPNVAGKVFRIVGKTGVNIEMISQASSALNISFVVKDRDATRVIARLHREFLEK